MIGTGKKRNPANWLKRTIADEPRLSELVELYKSLGFEVKVTDFNPKDHPGDCSECMLQFPQQYKVIYTRKNQTEGEQGGEKEH